jgi:glycosyltransferase involved in cell wall biosynthesis
MTDILICLHDFARGGTERIAIGLAADWARAGRDVAILCGSQEGGLRDTVDVAVRVIALSPPVPRSSLSRLCLGRAMAAQVAALQPRVIVLPGNFHLPLAPALRAAAPKARIVMKISNPPLPDGLAELVIAPLFRHFARAVDGFAALSSDFAQAARRLAPGKPVTVLHDPIYLHGGAGAPVPAHSGVCNILWAGRLEAQKDPELALQTLKTLNIPAHLTMLGDGSLRRCVERDITRLGLADRVTLTGAVPAIDPWLASADLLLLTSRYEGQPAVVGEALARGVPVVATDCAAMLKDMITRPEAGAVVTSRDPRVLAQAMETVCRAPRSPREKLAELVADYEPQACARAWLNWLDTL